MRLTKTFFSECVTNFSPKFYLEIGGQRKRGNDATFPSAARQATAGSPFFRRNGGQVAAEEDGTTTVTRKTLTKEELRKRLNASGIFLQSSNAQIENLPYQNLYCSLPPGGDGYPHVWGAFVSSVFMSTPIFAAPERNGVSVPSPPTQARQESRTDRLQPDETVAQTQIPVSTFSSAALLP